MRARPQSIETCPKNPEVPYVLLVGCDGVPSGLCIAEWTEDQFVEPTWVLWLNGSYYGATLDPARVIGWFEVDYDPSRN
jgi:hypothetical protein